MLLNQYSVAGIYQGSLKKGQDIISGLSAVLKEHNITAGMVSGIGAVSDAGLGFYDAKAKWYEQKMFEESLEIVSLKGNSSYKDNAIFPHLHAVLSGKDFSTIGGHLFSATVFAFEFEIIVFEGQSFIRGLDEETGLFLWKG